MASIGNVILGSAAALLMWTCIGVAVARAVLPQRALWWPVAPALGWAVHSAATLPLFMLIGFNRITVTIVTVLTVAAAAYALWRQTDARERDKEALGVPLWAWIGALVLALGPASAILPKFVDGAVVLSGPIFDHAKVAMIDEMVRLGLPPGNPFFGEEGQPSRLVYYYLLHFSAAELALLLGHQRLGGGCGADLVQRLRIADADGRARHLDQRTQARGVVCPAGLHDRIAAPAARASSPASIP